MFNHINLYKDVVIGVFYIGGVIGLTSGELILSTTMICAASLISHINFIKTA